MRYWRRPFKPLLLTFFYRYMRPLVEAGRAYIALPPCQMSKAKARNEVVEHAWTDGELARRSLAKWAMLQRYKGLGEMNDQPWETTMNPGNSHSSVSPSKTWSAERRVNVPMGDKVEPRRMDWG